MLRSSVTILYRLATTLSDRMTFQTEHDARLLYGESSAEKALVIRGGSSVELATFNQDSIPQAVRKRTRSDLRIGPDDLMVTMASRLLYDKGVSEYVEAAREIRPRQSDAYFVLAGERDPGNRDSVTSEDLDRWAEEGDILYVGYRDDMPSLLSTSDIIVLPTYYPEGNPPRPHRSRGDGQADRVDHDPRCRRDCRRRRKRHAGPTQRCQCARLSD